IDAGHQEEKAGDVVKPDVRLPRYQPPAPIWPHPERIAEVADMLLACSQPLIIGGRFGLDPQITAPLARLVEITGAGYLEDRAIACMPTAHPQNLTGDRKFRSEA